MPRVSRRTASDSARSPRPGRENGERKEARDEVRPIHDVSTVRAMRGVVFPPILDVTLWNDPFVDRVGFPVRGPYLELVWLPVVGPSVAWSMRCLHGWATLAPDGAAVPLDELAEAIGLPGAATAKTAPVQRTLGRMVRFGLAEWAGTLRVRATVPPLPQRHLARLSPRVQRNHERLVAARSAAPAPVAVSAVSPRP
jgi:hypothetical protein